MSISINILYLNSLNPNVNELSKSDVLKMLKLTKLIDQQLTIVLLLKSKLLEMFSHLKIVGCQLINQSSKGGTVFYVLTFCINICSFLPSVTLKFDYKDDKTLSYLLCSSYNCRHSTGEGERRGEKYV